MDGAGFQRRWLPHAIVRHSGIEILCHAIDLSQDPEELLNQIHDLAGLIATTRREPMTLPA
jgi:hypothetical protein